MADPNTSRPLELPSGEAAAFSQSVKRVDYDTVGWFASAFVFYSSRTEHDTMGCAINMLRRQLAEAGFDTR
jgi:hypothetical protein